MRMGPPPPRGVSPYGGPSPRRRGPSRWPRPWRSTATSSASTFTPTPFSSPVPPLPPLSLFSCGLAWKGWLACMFHVSAFCTAPGLRQIPSARRIQEGAFGGLYLTVYSHPSPLRPPASFPGAPSGPHREPAPSWRLRGAFPGRGSRGGPLPLPAGPTAGVLQLAAIIASNTTLRHLDMAANFSGGRAPTPVPPGPVERVSGFVRWHPWDRRGRGGGRATRRGGSTTPPAAPRTPPILGLRQFRSER